MSKRSTPQIPSTFVSLNISGIKQTNKLFKKYTNNEYSFRHCIKGNQVNISIIDKDNNNVGSLSFVDESGDSNNNSNNSSNNSNNNEFKEARNEMREIKSSGRPDIHINWISTEKKVAGMGFSYFLLKYFLAYLNNNYTKDNYYITLDDFSDKKNNKTFWEALGFTKYTNDNESIFGNSQTKSMSELNNLINNKIKQKMNEKMGIIGGNNKPMIHYSSDDKQYINTKNGKRKIHVGKRGGKYYMMNNKKVYIK